MSYILLNDQDSLQNNGTELKVLNETMYACVCVCVHACVHVCSYIYFYEVKF